jgi:hypothetical protein
VAARFVATSLLMAAATWLRVALDGAMPAAASTLSSSSVTWLNQSAGTMVAGVLVAGLPSVK